MITKAGGKPPHAHVSSKVQVDDPSPSTARPLRSRPGRRFSRLLQLPPHAPQVARAENVGRPRNRAPDGGVRGRARGGGGRAPAGPATPACSPPRCRRPLRLLPEHFVQGAAFVHVTDRVGDGVGQVGQGLARQRAARVLPPGEGATTLILEDLDLARSQGGRPGGRRGGRRGRRRRPAARPIGPHILDRGQGMGDGGGAGGLGGETVG